MSTPNTHFGAEAIAEILKKSKSIYFIGIGGISTAENVIEMLLAGATAVEIGAANLVDPFICPEIIRRLPEVMDQYGIHTIKEIIGGVHNG